MTIRLSTALRNNIVGTTGYAASFAKGVVDIYSGSQPVSADSPVTGTLLGRVTLSSASFTPETSASATLTIAGTAGSVATVNVGSLNIIPLGAVAYDSDATITALAVSDAINRNGIYTATSTGAVVTVKAPAGTGSAHNGLALAATVTGGTTATSSGNVTGGVDAVGGLTFGVPTSGSVSKTGVWSFNGVAVGTAGWFRCKASVADADGSSTTAVRLDGSIAVSGGDMSLSSLAITSGSPTTIDTFVVTMPAS